MVGPVGGLITLITPVDFSDGGKAPRVKLHVWIMLDLVW